MSEENKKNVKLDGTEITSEQLKEAEKNKSVRIIEDKNSKGEFRTLHKFNE